jgi:hypothetical protein
MDEDTKKIDSIFSANYGNERRALTKIEIVSIRILERWDECINLFQAWYENKLNNSSRTENLKNKLESVLYAIFLMNKELFKRKLKPDSYTFLENIKLSNRIKGSEINQEEYFSIINGVFDELGLVRVDYDRVQKTLEETNRLKGLD